MKWIPVILYLFVSCKEEVIVPNLKLCIDCTVMVEINNQPWECKAHNAVFTGPSMIDSTFDLTITDPYSITDVDYKDVLFFYQIPYDTGFIFIDSISFVNEIDISFEVYGIENDVPEERYTIIPDGTSYIHVKSLNKVTREFELIFHLNIQGRQGGPFNPVYPSLITFSNGRFTGKVRERP